MSVLNELKSCRERAAKYLESQVYETETESYWRHSPAHDPASRPSHLLYGTWSGALASVLLGIDTTFDAAKKSRIANALNRFQGADGTFLMPGVSVADRQGHDDEYFSFHCTNYALGALRALHQPCSHRLAFVESFRSREQLVEWFAKRDWSRPWTEGNNIVNLTSFYAVHYEDGHQWAWQRLLEVADWHDANQNLRTGFWHSDPGDDPRSLLYAMAGAAHNLHVYYYLNRDVPRPEKIIDSCLRLGYIGIRSACVDIDLIDILVNFRRYGYRRARIDSILKRYLIELLQLQNADGGFCDTYVTPENLYGEKTPARVSLTWATWFRLASIALISCALFPAESGGWNFRNTPGIGYCNLEYALKGSSDLEQTNKWWHAGPTLQVWLSTRREGRFLRQRITWLARQRLSGL